MDDRVELSRLDPESNKHLLLATKYVENCWFPTNQELLKKIQLGLTSGLYDADIELLIREVKCDFSLFAFLLRELACLAHATASPIPENPLDLIRQTDKVHLKNILLSKDLKISAHNCDALSDCQVLRLKEAMVSASAAEILSEGVTVDRELGYSAALLRQLGFTLIAWNYPHVYTRAFSSLKSGDSLEQVLSKVLGFSPTALAINIASKWGLSKELRAVIGDSEVNAELGNSTVVNSLNKICEVGEALARASDPQHYPSAKNDWTKAKEFIVGALGDSGFERIKSAIREHCGYYQSLAPELFTLPDEMNAQTTIEDARGRELLAGNQYVKQCPPILREQLIALYSRINPDSIAKENIDFLIKNVIPAAGFKKGCVYLIDPTTMLLMPRLKIGGIEGARLKAVDYISAPAAFDPIASAFRCRTPIMEDNQQRDDELVSFIVGSLGYSKKVGVLYLELGTRTATNPKANPMLYFKAILQALADCLNLA